MMHLLWLGLYERYALTGVYTMTRIVPDWKGYRLRKKIKLATLMMSLYW